MELNWIKTCDICPEQYCVKKGFNQVAYVRFRCGRLTVHCPNVDGEIIYTKKLCDEYPLPEKDKLEIERMLLKRIKPCNNSEV